LALDVGHHQAGNGCGLASQGVSLVLDLEGSTGTAQTPRRQLRGSRSDPQDVPENPTWGAPRIHGELLMLGFQVSERSVSRWMKRVPRDPQPAQRWRAFLRNHREAIAAMDFFTVPTISFGVLYCFFVIRHDRRCILHFNITKHPTSGWVIQQLRVAGGVSVRGGSQISHP
jgi:hypothetical protein